MLIRTYVTRTFQKLHYLGKFITVYKFLQINMVQIFPGSLILEMLSVFT